MSRSLERRHFFQSVFRLTRQAMANSLQSSEMEEATADLDDFPDLTPELLGLEAERLGLDPQKDRALIIKSIKEAMLCQRE